MNPKRGAEPAPLINPNTHATPELLIAFKRWPERFRRKVALNPNGCWEWQAAKMGIGYGRYFIADDHVPAVMLAHRHAYELTYQDRDITGTPLDHLCRNVSCVRPDHLEPVSMAANVRRGAAANSAGVCRAGLHPWTAENILHEPPRPAQPDGARRCRPCRDARERLNRSNREPRT